MSRRAWRPLRPAHSERGQEERCPFQPAGHSIRLRRPPAWLSQGEGAAAAAAAAAHKELLSSFLLPGSLATASSQRGSPRRSAKPPRNSERQRQQRESLSARGSPAPKSLGRASVLHPWRAAEESAAPSSTSPSPGCPIDAVNPGRGRGETRGGRLREREGSSVWCFCAGAERAVPAQPLSFVLSGSRSLGSIVPSGNVPSGAGGRKQRALTPTHPPPPPFSALDSQATRSPLEDRHAAPPQTHNVRRADPAEPETAGE